MTSSDRTLICVFKEIATMADRINLPKTIVDRANYLFKQVHDTQKLRRRPHDILASACLYLACREEGVPRTFKVIAFNNILVIYYNLRVSTVRYCDFFLAKSKYYCFHQFYS